MATLLELAMKTYNCDSYDWGGPSEGPPPYDGTLDIDNNGRLDIDCSHMVHNLLSLAGYNIPYMTTSRLNSPEALLYFDIVSIEEATEDDVVLYPHHVGVFAGFDPRSGVGEYFGAQSKGPSKARFNKDGTYGWNMNFKILRPKKVLLSVNSAKAPHQVKRWSASSPEASHPRRWRLEADGSGIGTVHLNPFTRWQR